MSGARYGIYVEHSSSNSMNGNTFANNLAGIDLFEASGNRINGKRALFVLDSSKAIHCCFVLGVV
jgi:parallel beta-helix repeat protein